MREEYRGVRKEEEMRRGNAEGRKEREEGKERDEGRGSGWGER